VKKTLSVYAKAAAGPFCAPHPPSNPEPPRSHLPLARTDLQSSVCSLPSEPLWFLRFYFFSCKCAQPLHADSPSPCPPCLRSADYERLDEALRARLVHEGTTPALEPLHPSALQHPAGHRGSPRTRGNSRGRGRAGATAGAGQGQGQQQGQGQGQGQQGQGQGQGQQQGQGQGQGQQQGQGRGRGNRQGQGQGQGQQQGQGQGQGQGNSRGRGRGRGNSTGRGRGRGNSRGRGRGRGNSRGRAGAGATAGAGVGVGYASSVPGGFETPGGAGRPGRNRFTARSPPEFLSAERNPRRDSLALATSDMFHTPPDVSARLAQYCTLVILLSSLCTVPAVLLAEYCWHSADVTMLLSQFEL